MDIALELRELARNLWWTWQPNVIAVFRDIDPALWRDVHHNPVAFLERLAPDRIQARAVELASEPRINYAVYRLHDYLSSRVTWNAVGCTPLRARPVAYFCAEFGLHESIPIYSGGLGILAGDYLKSASDLGIPLVGVGLLYAQGYFNQRLDPSGWQVESYYETEVDRLPLERALGAGGKPKLVRVETRAGAISAAIWVAQVGRSKLILLDSDVEENAPADRDLVARLYGGDEHTRIRQELLLGVGGLRALAALGIQPSVLHLNEGHSAFALLEAAREEMAADAVDFSEAIRRVGARTVFTTHTPVDAGHDRFQGHLVEETLGPLREALRLSPRDFMALGRVNPADDGEPFCMTVLGLKVARWTNGVSALHGRVTRRMWRALWPERRENDVPIGHVTNGVHVASWLAPSMKQLYDGALGADWEKRMCEPETWARIRSVEDAEIWEANQIGKSRLIGYVQRQICAQEARREGTGELCDFTKRRLDPNVLTIGFARRFATYKRGDLILSDLDRLARLIAHPERPIQLVFAGKAHPRDEGGKHLIRRIFSMCRDPRFLGRIAFLEDYDINVARHLLQGVDVWLNCPRRPLEASGTSGMKAVFNGALHLSVLDGWWAEAYNGENGFAIGSGGEHADPAVQDRRDAEDLYRVLEEEAIPLYYDRDARGIPRGWVARMKNAIESLGWRFNADRMVKEYARACYLPAVGAGGGEIVTVP